MKSNIKSYIDLYNKNKLETAKFKYNADFLLYYFDIKLGISLKLKKTPSTYCSSSIIWSGNMFFFTIYIPPIYNPTTYNFNGTNITIDTLHEDMTLRLLKAIYTIKKPDVNNVQFVYNNYLHIDSIIRELKIKMAFEDD